MCGVHPCLCGAISHGEGGRSVELLMMYTHFVYSVYMRLAQPCEQVFEHFN